MCPSFTFSRSASTGKPKKLSVICLNRNHDKYIEENLLSVAAQRFDDFEFLVADGGSTDQSLAIFSRYEFATVLPGADRSRNEGIERAVAAASGAYLMFTTSTDGYVSRNWFQRAVAGLDDDPEASLVWGASAPMGLDGSLGTTVYPKVFSRQPQKREWFLRWIFDPELKRSYLPELNYCVRRDIFRDCLGETPEFPELDGIDPILRFLFRFHRDGYFAKYVPVLANFGRDHGDNFQQSDYVRNSLERYSEAKRRYRSDLLQGVKQHAFRNGSGSAIEVLPRRQLRKPRPTWSDIATAYGAFRRSLRG